MEAKTFSHFLPKLTPTIKDSMEALPSFFTLHPSEDCNIKQIPLLFTHQLINCISKYYNTPVIPKKYICNRIILLLQSE